MTTTPSEHTHRVKCWPRWFAALDEGKRFEVRLNDRDYQRGDIIALLEWNPATSAYTSKERIFRVSYVFSGPGLADGYVVLGLEPTL
jgi:hypothetical protein